MDISSHVDQRTKDEEALIFSRIAWKLLPILTLAYVLNYLDRNNISFAALTMNRDVGLTATECGIGAGIFFLGYCFLELPSNMAMYRVGPRRWIAQIMISWGLISAATIFVTGAKSFYLMRFLLGAGEAGFFPGVAFYLGTWFPAHYRTRVIAWFMVAIPISSVVGSPISGLLLQMHGVRGLAGWQWLFVLEGVPAVLVGFAILWQIVDRPEDATWLDQRERKIVYERIASERRERAVHRLLPALKDPRVLILGAVQFGFLVGSYGVGIWLPQIIKAGNLSNLEIGFVMSACYLMASIGMIAWASHVDRGGNKVNNLAIACLVSALGFLFAIYSTAFWMSLSGITVSLIGINAARGLFFTIPLRFLTGMAAAGGLAFINSVGTAGGFVGPTIMGWLVDRTGSFSAGLATMAGFLLLAATMAASLKLFVAQD